ncbi:MAG: PleD family two-component system response regulator [Rickettsiaceae bacterium]|nr:PleD family two-component system response regulator [Rickettsiaceae bacterium]
MTATILVVDDLEANIRVLEAKLLVEYYTVLTATSGQEAIEILSKQRVDVILLDGMMPGMDGFETCKKIKSNPETAQIPVIMVTALSDIDDRIKGLEAGADEFLTKPVNDVALLARVRSLSRIKSMVDELKIRNQTSIQLGENTIEIVDKFEECQILVIDDDIVQSKNLIRSLTKLTPHVRVISDAKELDEINEDYSPDVIIISCQLSSSDPLRIAVTLRVKDFLRYTSFVLMTEEDDMSVVIKGMDLGVSDYFLYPIDENELLARIKTQLRRKKYQDSLRDGLEKTVSLSVKDPLSGLYNRRYFDVHIEHIIKKAEFSGKGFALFMLDIDHFKAVNDTYGHQAGDVVIKETAETIKNALRVTDLVSRFGGEEFAAIAYDVSKQVSVEIAERIRDLIDRHLFLIPGSQKSINKTVSIGICYVEGQKIDPVTLIKQADEALYEAKETGRNKVCVYGDA